MTDTYVVPWKRHRRHGNGLMVGHHPGDMVPPQFKIEGESGKKDTASREYIPPIPPPSPYRRVKETGTTESTGK